MILVTSKHVINLKKVVILKNYGKQVSRSFVAGDEFVRNRMLLVCVF